MDHLELVILGQAVLFIVFCLGPILVVASWIRRLGRDRTDDGRRGRAP